MSDFVKMWSEFVLEIEFGLLDEGRGEKCKFLKVDEIWYVVYLFFVEFLVSFIVENWRYFIDEEVDRMDGMLEE